MNSIVVGLFSTLKEERSPSPLDPIFPHDVRYLRRAFDRAVKAAGIHPFRFHDLRHTFASLLLEQRESLTYVKEQMGHSSINVTVDIYGHLVAGDNRQAVN